MYQSESRSGFSFFVVVEGADHDRAACHLSEALKINSSIHTLDLCRNQKILFFQITSYFYNSKQHWSFWITIFERSTQD